MQISQKPKTPFTIEKIQYSKLNLYREHFGMLIEIIEEFKKCLKEENNIFRELTSRTIIIVGNCEKKDSILLIIT